jgi:PIN domain nuclease of toxin-antitoxin system
LIVPGALLDSHALYWLATSPETMSEEALVAVAECQAVGRLYASPITAWELMIASRKPAHRDPTDLGAGPEKWFGTAVKLLRLKVVPIRYRIACEAAVVASVTGHKDPGDCYILATARIQKVPIISRDGKIKALSEAGHVSLILC